MATNFSPERLQQGLDERGWKAIDLAVALRHEASPTTTELTVKNWLAGRNVPTVDMLVGISRVLQKPLDWFCPEKSQGTNN